MEKFLDIAIPLVVLFEGCEKRKGDLVYPYLDKLAKPPVWTRGYGRTYGITETSSPITKDEAKQELALGLEKYANACVKLAPPLLNAAPCLAAVASWSWNCGIGAFRVSRLRKAINEGRWSDAAQHIKTPRTAGGVVLNGLARRRDTEADVFSGGITQ